jgi:hypothetical protein
MKMPHVNSWQLHQISLWHMLVFALFIVITIAGLIFRIHPQTPSQLSSSNGTYIRPRIDILDTGHFFRWISNDYVLHIPRLATRDVVVLQSIMTPKATSAYLHVDGHTYVVPITTPPMQVRIYAVLGDASLHDTHTIQWSITPRITGGEDISWGFIANQTSPASSLLHGVFWFNLIGYGVIAVRLCWKLSLVQYILYASLHAGVMTAVSLIAMSPTVQLPFLLSWGFIQLAIAWWYTPVYTPYRLLEYLTIGIGACYWAFAPLISLTTIAFTIGLVTVLGWLAHTNKHMARIAPWGIVGLGWVGFVMTTLRTYHAVNSYAFSQWLLSYDVGFIKRGLIGSLLPTMWQTPSAVAFISSLVWVILCIGTLWLLRQHIIRFAHHDGLFAAGIFLTCSPFIMVMSHVQGQFDHLIIPVSWSAVWVWAYANTRRRWWAPIALCIAVLIHEMTIFFVISAAVIVLGHTWAITVRSQWWSTLQHMSILVVFPLLITMCTIIYNQYFIDSTRVYEHIMAVYQRYPSITTPTRYAEWITMPFSQHLRHYGQSPVKLISHYAIITTLPILVLTSVVLWSLRPVIQRPWVFMIAIWVAVLCIQILHIVAYDTGRITSYAIGVCGFALLVRTRDTIDQHVSAPVLTILGISALLGITLLDPVTYWESMYENILKPAQRAWIMLIIVSYFMWRLIRPFIMSLQLKSPTS